MSKDRIIGIDLGTTNSCVAAVIDGSPRVLPNARGYLTTPSVVLFRPNGSRVVGQAALRQAAADPEHTVHGSKRLLGRRFNSPDVQTLRQSLSYKIVSGPGGYAYIDVRERQLSIPEINAMFLQELRATAEAQFDETITRAVVTVPAYFDEHQRRAVRDAGRIAGLDIVQVLNEPTAAAIAFGAKQQTAKTVLVFDLGGGTFDVSVVRMDGREVRVLATTGDVLLGGEDFDERIMAWMVLAFRQKHGIDLRDHSLALGRLREAARNAKVELTSVDRAEVRVPYIATDADGNQLHLKYAITREQFEAMTKDLVARTADCCKQALSDAALEAEAIDEVLLVGGMTRVPAVQAAVRSLFGKTPSKGVNPDEAVAVGAAIHAASLNEETPAHELADVVSQSLGIATADGKMDVIIAANTSIPATVPRRFTTSRDNQDRIRIIVLQGGSQIAAENVELMDFTLDDIRPGPAGSVEIEVAFSIDKEGLFEIEARDVETGQETQVRVTADSGLSADDVQSMSADYAGDYENQKQSDVLDSMRYALEAEVTAIERRARTQDIPAELFEIVTRAKRALQNSDRASIAECLTQIESVRATANA